MVMPAERPAEREKKLVALSSVAAAVFLTGVKVVVGLSTRSLGILSEAAHSGLDLFAAVVTYLAVRASDRPPDREHPYGHGKIENLSALLETILLLVTCGWIIYEAVHRLRRGTTVEVSVWSFAVMVVSIIIDFTRSRALMAAARKHGSQALEADALHFSTDIWSSGVVILGLGAVVIGRWLETRAGVRAPWLSWLSQADSVAALGVSAIVLMVSWRMGRRTIDVLIDRTSKELTEKIEAAVGRLPGVSGVQRVRLRQSGPATFVDMTLDVPRSTSLEEAHRLATEAEMAVQGICPRSDVMVHIDPVVQDAGSLVEKVRSAAARHHLAVHGIRAYDVRGRLSLALHVEVPEGMTLGDAHERATKFEADLCRETPGLGEIVTHIEPLGDREAFRPAVRAGSEEVRRAVVGLPKQVAGVADCHNIRIHREGGQLSVSFHCLADPRISVSKAHEITVKLEALLRAHLPDLGRVVIHLEPPDARDRDAAGGGAPAAPPP